MDRVEEVVVDATVDDVHRLGAGRGAHPHGRVAAVQVAALDELDAHVPGQERVLVVRGVVHAGCEDHDRGVLDVRGCGRLECVEEPFGVLVDRPDPMVGEDLRQHVGERSPVLQDVGDTRGVAQVVLEDAELARLVADEVDPRHVDADVVRRLDAPRLTVEVRRRRHEAARDQAVLEDLSCSVDVGEEGLERPEPLDDARLDLLPLGRGEHPGDEVHGQRPLALPERERDAVPVEVAIALAGPLGQAVRAEARQGLEHGGVGRPGGPVGKEHLVEGDDGGVGGSRAGVHWPPSSLRVT